VGENVVVSFGLPVSESPVVGFTATATPVAPETGVAQHSGFNPISFPISKLTVGATYTFSVQAENASGVGDASEPSNPITILAAPTGTTFANGQKLRLKTGSPGAITYA
jgi:hypothetical protein